ncbi:class I SAM-dependent methyltransferase [Umezawaea endophytica]|uniref:Class I SAM-dependent methyltransferase n=1 Tax=Umezawaea endophytica TaxID=1654476 RepID=A0A9X2VHU5_9PSEU|nr:class I SAM-dependent methyltransferase [Umezawaea endophytica]MCS7477020.1 class I SAM-dependent methyltransferase [Umezawaea endophytica]
MNQNPTSLMPASRPSFDYSPYAVTYQNRAEYVPAVIDALVRVAEVPAGGSICDIGAGSGHLTEPLLRRGFSVDAVEPTPAMRQLGEQRTRDYPNTHWYDGRGESSGRQADTYALVTFGSSFDLTQRPQALAEAARILTGTGYFACLWNHRVLDDPLQARVEQLIHDRIPDYSYGIRRTDQTPVIAASGLLETPVTLSGTQVFRLSSEAWCDAWASHSTVSQQSGNGFTSLVDEIRDLVRAETGDWIDVPYTTRAWVARVAGDGKDSQR